MATDQLHTSGVRPGYRLLLQTFVKLDPTEFRKELRGIFGPEKEEACVIEPVENVTRRGEWRGLRALLPVGWKFPG